MRASRLLSLLLLLQARQRMTARELAAELEVSIRTVYRDVESLSAAGVPVYADRGPDGGYRLLNGYRTRLTGLTATEAESLTLSALPGPASQLGLGDVLAAELKLMAALPPDLRTRASRIRERFHLDAPGWFRTPDDVPHLHAIADAVWNQRRIEVLYRRWRHPQQVTRLLEPLGVVLKAGSWYLIARPAPGDPPHTDTADPAPQAPRTYRVSRVLTLRALPGHFDRPDGFDLAAFWSAYAERFEADAYREHATVKLSPDGLTRSQILLPPTMARAALDTATPPGPDGWVHATLPIESVRHAHVEFLKLGADVEVIDPPHLRDMIATTARTLAARYRPDQD
ncbi:helix-turn-helix transcriptional regulator [Actinomadura mexicana]|uniref:Predicted DNA-binding transcriptional regulator YafY, contains an HTH and WYL domains n=1 Tax=Actinomadura mexicana TaxID=134959 RepID=A0A239E7D7_9ACTN|nr:WYL domain-containing protein [Actinomadura mexicana]SNS39794.1 Predicted DNA-binding transcriptional regulator YafY, contains an HTH and WYL domains [Actinomadura mexicana]